MLPARPHRNRLVRAGALCAVTALLLSGCTLIQEVTGDGDGSHRADEGEPTIPDSVHPDAHKYYEQELDWGECPEEYAVSSDKFECATAQAPMNWDDPSQGEPVELALIRLPAAEQEAGERSLFTNPGGPGAGGVDFVAQSAGYSFSRDLRDNFDIVGWDPRGVGYSSPVECYDDAEMDEYLYGVPDNFSKMSDAELLDYAQQKAADFGKACEENTGELLGYVDTMSTVRDLDMLRYVFGHEKLDYFGFSYGTDIGAHYIDTFPEQVGHIVLDGATDPTVPTFDVIVDQQEKFSDSIRAYLEDCLSGDKCPFKGDVDAAIEKISQTMDEVDATTPLAPDGRKFTSDVMQTAISAGMYSADTWPYVSDAFNAWYTEKNPSPFFLLADLYNDRNDDGTYSSNMQEAFTAINCLDYPRVTDEATIREYNERLADVTLFGPELTDESVKVGDITCDNWPVEPRVTEQAPVVGAGADPVLVVATTNDPATPLKWAEAVAEQLESATLLVYDGEGHIAYDENDECVVGTVDAYLIDGELPEDGTTC